MDKLTKKQRCMIEDNHSLIYSFAKSKNLKIEDYYDILALGLCNAAQIYDSNKGKFSTLAYRCMNNVLVNYYESMNKKSAIPEKNFFYSATMSFGNGDSYFDILDNFADNCCVHNIVESNVMVETIFSLLSEKERKVCTFLMRGMTQSEIANNMNCKRQTIQYYITQIRKKLGKYMNNY